MTCGDNQRCSKRNGAKEKYKAGAEQTQTSKKIEVGSSAMEE